MQGYTIKEVSKLIGICVATFYAWSREGIAPRATRIGRRVVIFEADYKQWLVERGVSVPANGHD